MKLAYGRVSMKNQSIERQIVKFREVGVEERYIFVDHQSGKNFDRPQYQAMKFILRAGDTLYVDALDRLGRNYDGVITEWKNITRETNADIVCLDNATLFDSRKFKVMGDIGKLLEDQLLSMLAYVAEQERKKTLQRQMEGMRVARNNGVKFGRPKQEIDSKFIEVYSEWKKGHILAVQAMKEVNMGKSTFYRRVKEFEQNN